MGAGSVIISSLPGGAASLRPRSGALPASQACRHSSLTAQLSLKPITSLAGVRGAA